MKRLRSLLLTLTIANGSHLMEVHATNAHNGTDKQLDKINAEISSLQHSLSVSQEKRENLITDLKLMDDKIKQLSSELQQLNVNIEQYQQLVKQLQQKTNQLQTQLSSQQQLLSKQLQASYKLGKNNFLSLLLSEHDPASILRLLTYYSYINTARASSIAAIQATQQQMEQNRVVIQNKLGKLSELQLIQLQQRTLIENNQKTRKGLVALLDNKITANSKTLKEDENNKRKLEALLSHLKTLNSPLTQAPFSSMHYQLIWPMTGILVNNFGQTIANSELFYNGITILAPEGTPVVAVYPGKVVFSDELRGFGQLLIIDHGHGYMTLYAHNQTLYKHRGDIVKSGDLIANSGHSGGFTKNGLYFEIRGNGKPLDPLQWLVKKA